MNKAEASKEKMDYPLTMRPLTEDEGGGYLIEFPDLPGCMSDDDTLPEAITNGMEAKADWIAAIWERGGPGKLDRVLS